MTAEIQGRREPAEPSFGDHEAVQYALLIRICAVITGGFGVVALLGWILGLPFLSSLGSGKIPMAPSTAVLFVLYGFTIFSRSRTQSRIMHWTGLSVHILGGLFALLLAILSYHGIYLQFERLGFSIVQTPGVTPLGHMSPLTALCFIVVSLSFLTSLSASSCWAQAAWLLAILLLAISCLLVLEYLFGTPLLYDSSHIPPALTTSIAFLALGTALLALANPQAFQSFRQAEPATSVHYSLIVFFAILSAGIIAIGYLSYRGYEKYCRADAEKQLSAIAALKVSELVKWRSDRMGDANIIRNSSVFSNLARRYFTNPQDSESKRLLLDLMGIYTDSYEYDQVRLLDPHGITRLSFPPGRPPLSTAVSEHIAEVIQSKRITIVDLYRHQQDHRVYLSLLIPILNVSAGNQAIGIVCLRVDPEKYIYPFLLHWPTAGKTAETLLLRREGDHVLYLNELKFKKDSALNLQVPMISTDMPAVKAVLGQTGIVEGTDYHGVPVVADVRGVPDSPWFMVTRIEASEVYAPVRGQLRLVLGLVLSLLFGVGAGLAYVWRQQSIGFYQEQYRAAEALRGSEEKYRLLYDSMTDAFASVDMTGHLQDFNQAFKDMLGYTEEELRGLAYLDLTPLKWYDFETRIVDEQVMVKGFSEVYEKEFRRKDGTIFPVELRTFLMRNSAGEPIGMWAIVRDITKRKRVEKDLSESEERFRNAFEHAAIGFTIYTQDGHFLRVNPALCNILGYSEAELTTRTFQDITHQDDLGFNMDQINQVLSGKIPVVHFQKRYIHKLGHEIWASVSVSVVRDDKGNPLHLISLVEDLSEKRKLEDQLRQSQKMEGIGQLAGGVAHDFNNILTAIMGYGSFALTNMAKDDPQRINIEHMLESAEKAAHLTKDLLLFSRKQISERKYLDLNEILKKMEKFLTRIIGEDIACKTILHPGALPVLADAHQLEQVMMNLATNARDAMPHGGVFSVTTEQIRLDKEFITTHGFGEAGQYALITVSDTGKGMDETTRQRIFEPFFTTREMGKGTGLGLAVVYGIVKGHDGYINVYSEPELGTTFKIYLPLRSMETEVTQELIEPVPLGKGERILIAEDDPGVRGVLRLSLEEYGYRVIEAENGEDAIKQYKDNIEKVSLVLLDVIMPVKNGREAYEEIKSLRPDTKVIFMSGYTDDIIMGKGLLTSGTELIPKPIAPDSLLRKVREVLDR